MGENQRAWSDLDRLCDEYVQDVARLDPIAATDWGLESDPAVLPDFSPSGLQQTADLASRMLGDVSKVQLRDETDHITALALQDRLGLQLLLHEGNEDLAELNNLASPLQQVRDAFSLMPATTEEDWEAIAARLGAVPQAIAGYQKSLALAAERGLVASRRQVEVGANQAAGIASPNGPNAFFTNLTGSCQTPLSPALSSALADGARLAAKAYGELSDWLRAELLPVAPQRDAVGRDRYELQSALFVGARVDLDETYDWGLAELERIRAQQQRIVKDLYGPGTSVEEGVHRLEADPAYQVLGTQALQEWLQDTADAAIRDLAGQQFDISDEIAVIRARIAPTKEGGIWYTGPSEDFSRPGQMWWSIPEGDNVFHTWQERTTVFHEGVPGHHLQIAQAVAQAGTLNMWRRLASWNSGHGEGWALYAEQLMADLGYQDDPANMMGMLGGQRLRAARVALDIGVHLGKERPDGQGPWDADYAWHFLRHNAAETDAMLRFELERYLGWPGQAPSYKIGQRLWEQLRDDYLEHHRPGLGRDDSEETLLRRFHSQALDQGGLPMDVLRQALLP